MKSAGSDKFYICSVSVLQMPQVPPAHQPAGSPAHRLTSPLAHRATSPRPSAGASAGYPAPAARLSLQNGGETKSRTKRFEIYGHSQIYPIGTIRTPDIRFFTQLRIWCARDQHCRLLELVCPSPKVSLIPAFSDDSSTSFGDN
jgi:hypothetical protein